MTFSLVTAGASSASGSGSAALVSTIVGRSEVTAFVAVAGLLFGSFLNVVIYRVPRHLSVVEPRSFCPHCDTPVRPVDNIPVVSWLVLGGRCHHCRQPISIRYPLVELGTGAVFAAVGWGLGPHWAVAGACVLAATLVALVAIERDGLALPLSVAAIGTAIAGVLLVAAGLSDRRWAHVVGAGVGAAVGAVLVSVIVRRHTGKRDAGTWVAAAPMVLPLGVALGWLGPAYAAEGLGTSLVVLLAVRGLRHARSSTETASVGGVFGLALALGVVVATVLAVIAGAGVGT
jgi:leader peptidase (prepilin peptidase)/N-methyltransferase